MQRISTTTKVVDKFGAGKHGFTNGNVVGGIPATDLEDGWFDNVQEEIANVIEAAGIVLSGADKTQLLQALAKVTPGRLVSVQGFYTPGASTYTRPANLRNAIVHAWGPGGGGAGTPATSGSNVGSGGGGAGGGYAVARYTAAQLGASLTVTIGTAGGGGVAGAAGSNGGTTSFGALLTVPGGQGAPATPAAVCPMTAAGGAPGALPTGTGILWANSGSPGSPGLNTVPGQGFGGFGGSSGQGGGGGAGGGASNGAAAASRGAGGGGANQPGAPAAARDGGSGAHGQVLVFEFE